MLNLNLNDLSLIGKSGKNIPTNQVTCSLCYNIAFNGKKCNNRKCKKVFCNICMQKQQIYFLEKEKKEFKCPFCMTFSSFSELDQNIIDYISSFKYLCKKNKNCKGQYTLEELIKEHEHKNDLNKEKCYVCKKNISDKNLNVMRCSLCDNICCFQNLAYDPLNNSYKNNNNINIKNCIQRCLKCESLVCKYCSKEYNNYIICDECLQNYKCISCGQSIIINIRICIFCKKVLCRNCVLKCEYCKQYFCKEDCLSKRILCGKCNELNSKINYFNCNHIQILNCNICYPKCFICNQNFSDANCSLCFNPICKKNCCIKCKFCSNLVCNRCTLVCLICKKIMCYNCAIICDECNISSGSIVLCKKCEKNNNIIQYCENKKISGDIFNNPCKKKLCINCWNVCNLCGTILCSKHCNSCTNCEDAICDLHYVKCKKCLTNDELTFVKICLEKCVLKCSFCDNKTTIICKEKNHQEDYVQNYGCPHNICNSCVEKCSSCGKIVRKCLDCIDYFYEFCRFCKRYQCLNCCKKCKKCDEVYCSLRHLCCFCGDICTGKCFNCDISMRIKCYECGEKLKICEICKNKYICSFECYMNKFKNNKNNSLSNHLCRMYACEKHFKI